ncbi:MAG: hypothetical protein U0Y68_03275 [Blastocatellia bacterium]
MSQAREIQSADTPPPLHPEMAHILFMDLVGYSKLPTAEQVAQQQTLHQCVQKTQEYQRAQQLEQLISLPTGDGMALVFFRDPVAPVQCAVELAQLLLTQPEIHLRMGIHSGLVYRVADINANRNVAGGGINIAQRVMDCGDAGHILLSSTVAGVLREAGEWNEYLTDWGEQEVKHGARVQLFNLYTGKVGRQELPAKLQSGKASTTLAPVRPKVSARLLLVGAVLLAVAFISGLWWWPRTPQSGQPSAPAAAPSTRLSYSLRTRAKPQKNSQAKEESLPGEIIFTPDDELRLTFVGAQDGYFYLLNEGPQPVNGLPRYNLLFPAPSSDITPTLRTNQPLHLPQEKPPWFQVDAEQGTEIMWLIWSATPRGELEPLRQWLNPKDGGEIKDASDIKQAQEFLRQHYPAAKPSAEKDEQQTHLKGGSDGLLIYKMNLAHR